MKVHEIVNNTPEGQSFYKKRKGDLKRKLVVRLNLNRTNQV